MKIFVFDLDGTICSDTNGRYNEAIPVWDVIRRINSLYKQGNTIIIFTARGTTTGINWKQVTEKQLALWGVKYHKLIMGKPHGDVFIDDRCINIKDWMKSDGK